MQTVTRTKRDSLELLQQEPLLRRHSWCVEDRTSEEGCQSTDNGQGSAKSLLLYSNS